MQFHNLFLIGEAVFALGVLIFVHELGHFLVAKLSGIRVETFSLGFGPELVGFTRGGTRYKISAFPLGGYVKPAGETEDAREQKPDEFLAKPWWIRAAVLFAGPAMNFIFPVVFLFVLYVTAGKPLNLGPASVRQVMPGKPAATAGLKVGDEIIKVDGKEVGSYDKLAGMIDGQSRSHPDAPLTLDIRRDGKEMDLHVQAAKDAAADKYRIGVAVEPGPAPVKRVVQQVLVGTPAEKAGFMAGDEILSVNGQTLVDGAAFPLLFARSSRDPVPVEILRQGQKRVIEVSQKQPVPPGMDHPEEIGLLGLELQTESGLTYEKMGPVLAAKVSFYENAGLAVGMVYGIYALATGQLNFKESIGGPITIMRMAHQQAQSGFVQFLDFICRISIMLCIMNLLPVPLLDGGTLALFLLEGLRGKPISVRAQVVLQNIGLALLVSLMLFATYNDILNWVMQALRTGR